ncbi:14-3-3 domain protein [Niveomyces insectorum RCEF 264]|uniref:14-3-3 domain protein n=1 Tax=Niveomyces insectorum RCEF 264 TaxID=1081102 RepID=A0A167TCY0_9HYPO|nr:14-3-3 domain protein [Niveomyces insectorum RCEF 264]
MASSEVDQKYLGKLAKAVEDDNPLLATMLFKILGLSINLSQQLVVARKNRRRDVARSPQFLELYLHIIWLSREGLVMLEQYVLPVVGKYVELKVLAYKLRASFYHIFVLFYNQPPLSTMGLSTPEVQGESSTEQTPTHAGKGKGLAARADDDAAAADAEAGADNSRRSSLQPTHPMEGGPVGPPPGFGPEPAAAFLLPAADYLPLANRYFKNAVLLAERLLWGSHSLRLSVKTEYAAFLYDCVHDAEGSRNLARDTIAEVYEASEGIDNDMFNDACELVTVLGKMMKRGLPSSTSSRTKGGRQAAAAAASSSSSSSQQYPQQQQQQQQQQQSKLPASVPRTTNPPLIPTTTTKEPPQAIHTGEMGGFI